MLSAVPWTRTTGRGWAALGLQATLAPGGGGVAAAAGPAVTRSAAAVRTSATRRGVRDMAANVTDRRCVARRFGAARPRGGRGLDERLGQPDPGAVPAALRVPLDAERETPPRDLERL